MANENLPPAVIAQLLKELRGLARDAPDGIAVTMPDDNVSTIHADIRGPEETPYHRGVFKCKLILGSDYPANPPKAVFVTKIFHPNVNGEGLICVNALKRDWQPTQGIRHTLSVIRCLLICPNAESALNEEAGKLLLENYDGYASRAMLFTKIYAMPAESCTAALQPGGGTGASKAIRKQKRSIKRL
ncbi:unnamed protein product (mitochondrion) [Plasmodiophora brassicae]|uniref:E2 ubiquitin-conjugating enzyme n=1 Tax=Plasmodiophora brassicae TaxID=37360 RepID=A0A0G4INL9_PLABS|nr:hypothetical protein PBRA_005435 [Plasmodiophora brassicae]SPR01788.1 unnamed protein product [Plasmodiophora brassicae]